MSIFIQEAAEDYGLPIDKVIDVWDKYVSTKNYQGFYKELDAMEKKITEEKINSQIGCGYCAHEKTCTKRDPKINKAKEGCEEYLHYTKDPNNKHYMK